MAHHHHHPGHDHDHDHDHGQEPGGGPLRFSDPAQESLSQALKAGFNVLRLIMVVLLVAYFFSGWFEVGTGEQGLIIRFGKLLPNSAAGSPNAGTPIFDSGWHASFPDPIDEKIAISGATQRLNLDTFLFARQAQEVGRPIVEGLQTREQIDPKVDGTMITGDRNLSHGLWQIEYRIERADKFVENVWFDESELKLGGSPREELFKPFLRRIAEAAIVRTVAGLSVERVTNQRVTEGGADFTLDVMRRINEELARFDTGVVVTNVTAETVEPGGVREAFVDVTRASNERTRLIREAEESRIRTLSQTAGAKEQYESLTAAIEAYGAAQTAGADDARLEELRGEIDRQLELAGGEVAQRISAARSRATQISQTVQQEYEEFLSYREQYLKYPDVTAMRLWVKMRTAILSSKLNELFFVPDSGPIEIIVNRDLQKLIDADLERFQSRQ